MKEFLKMLTNRKPAAPASLSYYQQETWKTSIKEYLGKTAIYISNSKKENPKLVIIKEIHENLILLEETLYTKDALPRGNISISVSLAAFICGDVKLVVINEQ
jgi:hypothetical protein